MNRKSVFSFGLAVALLGGCAASSVEYVDNGSTTEGEETTVAATEAKNTNTAVSMKWNDDHLDGATWTEKITAEDELGREVTFKLNVTLKAPQDRDSMSVYEYETIERLEPEEKKEYMEQLFDNGVIYMYDAANVPKGALQQEAERFRERRETLMNQDSIDAANAIIADIEQQILTAPDMPAVAKDFSGDNYFGFIDGLPYSLRFTEIDRGLLDLNGHFFKEELQSRTEIGGTSIQLNYVELESKEHKEETMKQRQENELALVEKVMAYFDQKITLSDGTVDGTEIELKKYTQGPGAFPVGSLYNKVIDMISAEEEVVGVVVHVPGNSITSLLRFDDYNSEIKIESPYRATDISGDVTLLPFEQIAEVIRNELQTNPTPYVFGGNLISFDSLERGYIEVIDKDHKHVSMVPCWRLQGDGTNRPLIINAIDGSVIELMYL